MATMRLVPSTIYNAAGTNYLTISNADNAYTNTDSTNYATIQNTYSSTSNRYIYLRGFNFSSIPSDAIVSSFTVKFKAYESGLSTNSSYRPYLCNDTTTITGTASAITATTTTQSFTGVTADWDTIKGYGTNGSNFGIRFNVRRNSRNTTGYLYLYGAEIEVTYTIPVYHSVTASTSSGSISPSGTTSVLEGDDYTLTIDVTNPTVTDNGVDVTSQLTQTSGGTTKSIPEDYESSGFTVSNITNAYTDEDSDTYAQLNLAGRTTGNLYLDMEDPGIPSGATILSVSAKATLRFSRNGSSSSVTASCQMYSGTTAKGSSTTIVSSATDVAQTTYNLSVGSWTASELSNARFHLTEYNGASSTVRYMYVYGVSLEVTYEMDGVVYIYTLTNVTTDHTIVVSAGSATKTMYVKLNGAWVPCTAVYKKVNGSWVQQTDISNVFQSGVNYKYGSG